MTRALAAVFTALLLPAVALAAVPAQLSLLRAYRVDADVVTAADGRVLDLYRKAPSAGSPPPQNVDDFIAANAGAFFLSLRPDLRLITQRQSLTGLHSVYQQFIDGSPVLGSEMTVDTDRSGGIATIHNRVARITALRPARLDASGAEGALRALEPDLDQGSIGPRELVLVKNGEEVRRAWRVIARPRAIEPWEYLIDAATGELLEKRALFFNVAARVFDPNPVVRLNAPGLQDQDNSSAAVPDSAYSTVDLPGLAASGPLSGPNVRIVDREQPFTPSADSSQPLIFDRGTPGFEEVMAYFHLDRSQRYLQSLGYTGALRIVAAPLEVDAHGGSADNSFFTIEGLGQGRLYFGDGGVDDAEDADIVLHEYGHAIHDSIAPGVFMGPSSSEGRAMSEGFGDYWAFSSTFAATVDSGRDPFCIADWDARCADGPSSNCSYPRGADCLRRVDGSKTIDDFIFSNGSGTEHANGEIWSSSLRRLFMALIERYGRDEGRKISDRLVLEGMFGTPPSPTFKVLARQIIDADRELYAGANSAAICAAMTPAKILSPQECGSTVRGELTLFQSSDMGRSIPDADPNGIISSRIINDNGTIDRLYVQVKIQHPFRGDLQLTLIAPDGTSVLLQQAMGNPGTDLDAIYGYTSASAETLDVLRGRSAHGEWKLKVVDARGRDTGRLLSWGVIIRFSGAEPLAIRPVRLTSSRFLPVVTRAAGVGGSFFRSDVRIYNGGNADARMTAFFTPSGADGTTSFSAMQLDVAPGQVLTLDDIVTSLFGTTGLGTMELRGDLAQVRVSSRIYTEEGSGTYGQFIDGVDDSESAVAGQSVQIPQLQNNADFRANVGFAEVAGSGGVVRVTVFDETGRVLQTTDTNVLPFSHVQSAILGGSDGQQVAAARAEVSVIDGNARVVAYGSVVDNRSGDAIYIPAVRPPMNDRTVVIPAVIHADGVPPTRWRSDVWLTNPGQSAFSVAPSFYPLAGDKVETGPTSLGPGGSAVLNDVVQTEFGRTSSAGQLEIFDSKLIVTSRSWTPSSAGSVGQFIPARDLSDAIGIGSPPAAAIQVETSDRFRTNAGVSEVTGKAATVRVRLMSATGLPVFERVLEVPPHGQMQFNLQGAGAPQTDSGRIEFQVTAGEGRVLGYASVIDNISGDSIYVPAK